MFSLILEVLGAIAAYIKYRFDPEMVKRRDEINKQIKEESGHDNIDKIFADKDTISLSYFVSEYLRRMREPQTDNTSRRAADLLIGVLPAKRNEESRNADPTEGLSG